MSSSGEQDHLLLTLQTNRKENGNRQLWLIGYQSVLEMESDILNKQMITLLAY